MNYLISTTLLAILLVSPAFAEPACKVAVSPTESGDIRSAFADGSSAIQISAASDSSAATIKFASDISSRPDGGNCLDPKYLISSNWDVTLSAPLGDEGDARDVATLDGLATGISLKLGYSRGYTFGFDKSPENIQPLRISGLEVAHEACLAQRSDNPALDCTKPDLNDDDSDAYIAEYASKYFSENLTSKSRTIWLRGTGEIGYDDFGYVNPSTLTKETTEEIEYKFGVAASYVSFERNNSYTAGVEFQSAFDEADEAIICVPSEANATVPNCVSGRPGAPSREDAWLGYVEYRYVSEGFGFAGRNLGIAPRVTHNFNDEVTGVSLPVFLQAPKSAGITSGINLGWRDDTDEVTIGLFIGGSLSLFE